MNTYELTPAQRRVYKQLPATAEEVATTLNITSSTVRDHLSGIEDAGYPVVNHGGTYYRANQLSMLEQHPSNYNTRSKPSKTQQTRAANQHLAELNDRLCDLLDQSTPAIADGGLQYNESNEDVVIHRSDDHIGAEVHDEHGNLVFNHEIAADRIRSVTDSVMNLIEREGGANREYDTAHLLLDGDTVTGENIFSHQPHEIDLTLDEQIDLACKLYLEQIRRLSARFPSVQVVCQAGNHGELRADGMSENANADKIVYMMLDRMVRIDPDLDNVTFIRSDATRFINFRMRVDEEADREKAEALGFEIDELPPEFQSGHRAHMRHGQNSLAHIGTTSGKSRWRGWQIKHLFDIAYRAHYHEFKLEHVMNRPVLMSGSICPPSDFEESFSVWSEPAATVHGVTDDYPLAWVYPVQFDKHLDA